MIPVRLLLLPFKVIWYFIEGAAKKFWENRSPLNWTLLGLCVAFIISFFIWRSHDDLKWKQPKSMFDDDKHTRHAN